MTAGDWKEMYQAVRDGDVELVRHHLQNGVDANYAHPEFQSTALVTAILARNVEVAHLLLDHGADPTLCSPFDEVTPIQAARQVASTSLVERIAAGRLT